MKKHVFPVALGISLLAGCFSSTEPSADDGMDIKLKKLPAQVNAKQAEEVKKNSKVQLVLSPNEKIDWQRFFKAPPSNKERSLLATQIKNVAKTEDTATLIKRGRNEVALGRMAAAEASFQQVLRNDDENTTALLELSQLYLRRKNTDRAFEFLAQLRKSIQTAPTKNTTEIFRYRYTLATAYIARGDIGKGHKVLSDLISLDKTFSPAYGALASSYLNLGKIKVAEFIAKRGVDRGKEDASLQNILGVIAQRNNKPAEARGFFREALRITPTYAPAIVNRANARIEVREFDAAEADLQKAISYSPANPSAYVSLGICQKKMGRFDSAKSSFVKAIELDPNNAAGRLNLGILMTQEFKKPNVGLRLFHEVLQTTDPNDNLKKLARLYIEDIRENRQP